MFLRYIDFIFQPFRAINNKWLGVKNIKGNIQVDVNRAKSLGRRGKYFANEANQKMQGWGGQPGQQGALPPGQQPGQPPAQQGYQPQMGYQQQGAGGYPMQPQQHAQPQNQNPYGYQQGAQN